MLSRRQFLIFGGGVAVSAAAGVKTWSEWGGTNHTASPIGSVPSSTAGVPSSTIGRSSSAAATSPATSAGFEERALVVVQLGGGNDGLNTLVPTAGAYHDARPTLGIVDTLVPVPGTGAYGLHPALAPLKALLDAGHVAVLESIGFPHPDRSHFAASDVWWSATPDHATTTGWLGRYLDATSTRSDVPLRAVSLGGGTPALTGEQSVATVVFTPEAFRLRTPPGSDATALIDAWAATAPAAQSARRAVEEFQALNVPAATTPSTDTGAEGEAAGDITAALDVAARLLAGDQGTQVVYVNASGFDTHANQAATQPRLLADLATGIARFEQAMTAAHRDDRVLLITVSEFGRRVAQNGSGGTDHGKASVQFAVGPMVKGGVYGELDLAHLDDGDVAAQIDARSLYAAALDWLGAPTDEILQGRFDRVGVVA